MSWAGWLLCCVCQYTDTFFYVLVPCHHLLSTVHHHMAHIHEVLVVEDVCPCPSLVSLTIFSRSFTLATHTEFTVFPLHRFFGSIYESLCRSRNPSALGCIHQALLTLWHKSAPPAQSSHERICTVPVWCHLSAESQQTCKILPRRPCSCSKVSCEGFSSLALRRLTDPTFLSVLEATKEEDPLSLVSFDTIS